MKSLLLLCWRLLFRCHFALAFGMVVVVSAVIGLQITDRAGFADSELRRDVMERWGAPIEQPAPSVRYVESGAVFNTLRELPLSRQRLSVDAEMNYRKRGLVYFSGFQFVFQGQYLIENPAPRDIDVVFVFPIRLQKNQVLLSNLAFSVDGRPVPIALSDEGDKLMWTGRLKPAQRAELIISFGGRGLDAFCYRLDPALPVKDFSLEVRVRGGRNYDYPAGVVPAHRVEAEDDLVTLRWDFPSLESGVPAGLILPSEQSFDRIITTILARSWLPFLLLWAGLTALFLRAGKPLELVPAVLLAAGFSLFYILLAYLAAFMHFYLAFGVSALVVHLALMFYVRALLDRRAGLTALLLCAAFLLIPALAVVLEGFTGLIYTLEITLGVIAAMVFSTKNEFAALFDAARARLLPEGGSHAH
jgi:hypothetical protein